MLIVENRLVIYFFYKSIDHDIPINIHEAIKQCPFNFTLMHLNLNDQWDNEGTIGLDCNIKRAAKTKGKGFSGQCGDLY